MTCLNMKSTRISVKLIGGVRARIMLSFPDVTLRKVEAWRRFSLITSKCHRGKASDLDF